MALTFIAFFWGITLLLFFIDPFETYKSAPNQIELFVFMTINIMILLAVDRTRIGLLPPIMSNKQSAFNYFRLALIVSLIFLPLNIHFYTGSSLSDFTMLLTNPAEAYQRMHFQVSQGREERLGFLLAKLAVSWLTVALVPLAILLQKTGVISLKALIAVLAISFVLSVFRGTDKELADIMIFLIAGIFIPATHAPKARSRRSFKLFSRRAILMGIAGAVFLYFFAFRKSERLALISIHCFQNTNICMQYPSSEASPFEFLGMMLYRYATHGYYGLSTSFDANASICPIIGDSRVLQFIFSQFGMNCGVTITDQLDGLGWTSRGAWSTGFTQLANNFGHIMVFFYILFFAASLKLFHNTYTRSGCYLSGILFFLNFFILFYMVGNLQLQQVGEQYFGYIFLNLAVLLFTIVKQSRKS